MNSMEDFLGRLAQTESTFLTVDDFDGANREAVIHWQSIGIVAPKPSQHPCPTCPHCRAGMPYQIGEHWLCDGCLSCVAEEHLWAWPIDASRLLDQLANHLQLRSDVQSLTPTLWRLGNGNHAGQSVACFAYLGDGALTNIETQALRAYRSILVLHGPHHRVSQGTYGHWVPLAEILATDGSFVQTTLATLLQLRGEVRFDEADGSLLVNGTWIGELVGDSKERHLMAVLARHRDQFVSYRELKRAILDRTGSRDSTDDATFCQKLKSRIKRQAIPSIDRFIVTSNKGEGYCLRGSIERI